MSNDIPEWEKKYWADRAAKMPHYKPAHETQNNISVQGYTQPHIPNNGIVDVTSALQQRIAQQASMASAHTANVCMVKEGSRAFRMLPTDGFGTTVPLVVDMGPLTNVAGKQFENKGYKRCFLVDNNNIGHTVDLSEMSNQPDKFLNLIQLNAPFIGSIFVSEQSMVEINQTQNNHNKNLLKG